MKRLLSLVVFCVFVTPSVYASTIAQLEACNSCQQSSQYKNCMKNQGTSNPVNATNTCNNQYCSNSC